MRRVAVMSSCRVHGLGRRAAFVMLSIDKSDLSDVAAKKNAPALAHRFAWASMTNAVVNTKARAEPQLTRTLSDSAVIVKLDYFLSGYWKKSTRNLDGTLPKPNPLPYPAPPLAALDIELEETCPHRSLTHNVGSHGTPLRCRLRIRPRSVPPPCKRYRPSARTICSGLPMPAT
ncbi:protein of unknown function [Pararobbsia alpina]